MVDLEWIWNLIALTFFFELALAKTHRKTSNEWRCSFRLVSNYKRMSTFLLSICIWTFTIDIEIRKYSSNLSRGATLSSSNSPFSLSPRLSLSFTPSLFLALVHFLDRPKSNKSLINILWQVETAVGQNANDPPNEWQKRSLCFSMAAVSVCICIACKNIRSLLVLLSTGRERKKNIIPIYWLLFSINLNSSNATAQIPYITSDFRCKYLQLWWNWLTLCSCAFIHSFMVWSLFRVCMREKKTKICHSRTCIASTEHKTKCTIMWKLSVHELVIGLNVQRNGQMKLTVPLRKRSSEVNGFLLQYSAYMSVELEHKWNIKTSWHKKRARALCTTINEYDCKPIPQVDLFEVSQFNHTYCVQGPSCKWSALNEWNKWNEFEW